MNVLFTLHGLDDVDWSSLEHAYGPATHTAEDLRGLASSEAEVRSRALQQLEMSICHQGSLYSATAPAIPFLLTAAEQLSEEEQAYTTTVFGGDLMGLIEFIAESASCSPGWISETVYQNWARWHDPIAQGDPRLLAVDEISVYRGVLKAYMDNWERVSCLLATRNPELLSKLSESATLAWANDFGAYVRSRPAVSAGVAQTVLAEPVGRSYKALAKKLDPAALSATIIWWALEQELDGDLRTLAKDSLARDLTQNIRRGWKSGLHHDRQAKRFWENWSLRFIQHSEAVASVKEHLEEKTQEGWLPQSREDDLIVEAIGIGFDYT